jgi:hypothetical protein
MSFPFGSGRGTFPEATPNPSIERTFSSRLRLLPAAAHVKLQGLPSEVKR